MGNPTICIYAFTVLIAAILTNSESLKSPFTLTSEVLSPFGNWEEWENCPTGSFVTGFDVNVQVFDTPNGLSDSAGLTSIVMECSNPINGNSMSFVFSIVEGVSNEVLDGLSVIGKSRKGDAVVEINYSYPLRSNCQGLAIGFQIMAVPEQIAIDNPASTNLRLLCSELKQQSPSYIEGYGEYKGEWQSEYSCRQRQGICGLQTQSDAVDSEAYDNKAINGIRVKCCDVPNPASTCVPYDVWEVVQECDNVYSDLTFPCSFPREIGTKYGSNTSDIDMFEFNEGIGYSLSDTPFYLFSALSKNFAENIGLSDETRYDWGNPSDEIFASTTTETVEYIINPKLNVRIYQAVGKCSYFSIKTPKFKIQMEFGGSEKTQYLDTSNLAIN